MASARAIQASALAAACSGRLVGADVSVRGVRALELAGPDELSFVADAKTERKAAVSRAGVLLARSAERLPGRCVIEVPDPQLALAAVLLAFHPRRIAAAGVHPTAVVASGAAVDPTAEIGPFAVVGEGSEIGAGVILEAHVVLGRDCRVGAGSWIHPHVTVYDGVVLGARVEVHSGAVLGADGFGYAATPRGIVKIPQVGRVVVEDDAEIGANSCVDRAALEVTRIGAGTKIDDLVMIGHNSDVGRHGFLCAQVGLAGSSVLGDGVVLAGQVGVGGHLRIGNGAKVGAQSGIMADLPDGAQVMGSPEMDFKQAMKTYAEIRKLPETARLVRRLARHLPADAAPKAEETPETK